MTFTAEDFQINSKNFWNKNADIDDWQVLSAEEMSSKDIATTSEWRVEDLETDISRSQVPESFSEVYIDERMIQLKQIEGIISSSNPLTCRQESRQKLILKNRFDSLADNWKKETCGFSSITKKITNLNYLKIIALGEAVVPFILDSLARKPDHWFVALKALTDEDPTEPDDSFEQAAEAWANWGREKGLIR